jgi:excisionase family DNA binding protein
MSEDGDSKHRYLSVSEFAQRTDFHERTIRRKIKKEEIKALRGEGRRKWLIPESEVDRFTGVDQHKARTQEDSHYEELAEIADHLIRGCAQLPRVGFLSNALKINAQVVREQDSELAFEYLVSHLHTEFPGITSKGFDAIAEEKPDRLLRVLKVLAEGSKPSGTCPRCNSWQVTEP